MFVGTFGALSGGVFSQLAQGSAAQAWSGVSGVANGMQNQMDHAFSGLLEVKRRQDIAVAARRLEHAAQATDSDKAVNIAMQTALDCTMGATNSDAAALKAVSETEPTSNNPSGSAQTNTPATPPTTPQQATSPSRPVSDRLRELKAALDANAIDSATYDEHKRRILSEL